MHGLLVVDDLPIIVDGLTELFQQADHLELDVMTAYSGEEALEVLRSRRVDIVISDIHMPGLEGIQLLQEIKASWPECVVIFLTGYNDFHYVQDALRYGGFEYILKVESDEKIVRSVERAIDKIMEKTGHQEMIDRARSRMRLALPSLRKEYVSGLLQGKQVGEVELPRQFAEIDFPLSPHHPVMVLLGRVDAWRDMMPVSDKELFLYAIQNIAEEYLLPEVSCFSYAHDTSKIVWLIQPAERGGEAESLTREDGWEIAQAHVSGILNTIQRKCKQLLKLPVSFVRSSVPSEWKGVSDRFHSLNDLFLYDLGLRGEIMMTDDQARTIREAVSDGKEEDYFHHNRIQLLLRCLENNHREEFFRIYNGLMKVWSNEKEPFERKVELYHSLSAILLSYINRNNEIKRHVCRVLDLDPLFQYRDMGSWDKVKRYFLQMVETLWEWNAAQGADFSFKMIQTVHHYIEDNIMRDISLNSIADHVGMNRSYFSRLYKQMTGKGLSDYINDYRNLKAKELLLNSSMKVGHIAEAVGYNSALAFIRFFKKHNHLTPQEYRTMTRDR